MQEHHLAMYRVHAQLAGFKRRVARSEEILREFLSRYDAPYIAFSGGKDSLACMILLHRIGRTDIPVFTQGDDFDWPEKRAYCEDVVGRLGFSDYEYVEAQESMMAQFAQMDFSQQDVFDDARAFFGEIKRYVQRRGRNSVILGLRAEESGIRKRVRVTKGLIYDTKHSTARCLPIGDWLGADVFALIVQAGLPWFHLYDRDDECLPHERRLCWLMNPRMLRRGVLSFLRRHYPAHYRRVVALNPDVTRFG